MVLDVYRQAEEAVIEVEVLVVDKLMLPLPSLEGLRRRDSKTLTD